MGAPAVVGTDAVPVLRKSGQVELSVYGLCDLAARTAAVRCSSLYKLVPSPGGETGKLEGENIRGSRGLGVEDQKNRDRGAKRYPVVGLGF